MKPNFLSKIPRPRVWRGGEEDGNNYGWDIAPAKAAINATDRPVGI
jgi:hypothetical protein